MFEAIAKPAGVNVIPPGWLSGRRPYSEYGRLLQDNGEQFHILRGVETFGHLYFRAGGHIHSIQLPGKIERCVNIGFFGNNPDDILLGTEIT